MLVTIPGSVEVYRAVPRVPSGVAEPELVTTMLRPVKWKKGRLGLVGCLLFSLLTGKKTYIVGRIEHRSPGQQSARQ